MGRPLAVFSQTTKRFVDIYEALRRPGVYSVSDRHITVKQILISAGLNVAQRGDVRIDLTRRTNRVESKPMANVTLKSLMSGDSPDVYLEPYDTLVVSAPHSTTKPTN
jgi:hypothetical protein